jgi:nitric oxide reductase NorD protein
VSAPAGGTLERYELLASAIAGRRVRLAGAGPDGISWTDGATIYVEDGLPVSDRLCRLAVQASLLGADSLEPGVVDHLSRSARVTRRYLTVEGQRALAALEPLLPAAARALIDHEVSRRSDSAMGSLSIASSRESLGDLPEAFGTIRPRRLRRDLEQSGPGPDTASGHRPRSQAQQLLRELDDAQDDPRPGVDLISSPVGGGGAIGKLLKRLFGDSRTSTGGPPGADSASHRTRHGATPGRSAVSTLALPPGPPTTEAVVTRGATYPEWDVHRRRYRDAWCTVSEVTPEEGEAAAFGATAAAALRRPLARLGTAFGLRDRQRQGTDVDIDAAIEAHVETIAGSTPPEGLYLDMVRCRRDLAVLLLLDVSGSAGEPSATGGTVHEHQCAAAAALATALGDLGDRVALFAFRSQGRSAVHLTPLKRFDDRLDALVLRRLAGCEPGAYTRLGAAIRHGTAVLTREAGTSRRLLVVLSDGFAYDHGYEGAYGEADARRALSEARRSGTGCVCLSVGAATDAAALRRVFGTAAHAGVARLDQLSPVVAPLFRFALVAAEAQQRRHQHTARSVERLQQESRSA